MCNERTATIHLTEISEGMRMESHLCEICAQKQGLAVKSQIPLNELLSTLLAAQSESQTEAAAETAADVRCPVCGMTFKKFIQKSHLGCHNDYKAFGEPLKAVIQKAQNGSLRHRGKVPAAAPAATRDQIRLINLRQQLEEAVRNEDYETAAKLRDMMESMQ
ncbi:MAG TPA: UvrB/UvrC motif-containing protein [Anaerohalosphaeraceae bacterium]|nr:UvrB/UvrC motif-containing protein [Anaerohalosphaeraceae bacterium]